MVRFPDTKSAKHKNVITRRKPYSLANKSFLSFPPHYKIIWTGHRGIIDALTCKIVLNCIGTKTSEQSVSVRSRKFKTRRNVVESSSLRGELCGWIVEIIPTNALLEGRSILKNNQTYVSNSGEIIELAYADTGDCTEPLVDWGYGQKQASPFVKSPPLQVPKWPRTAGFGRVVPINLTLAELNTVYSGPGLLLANGKLEVSDNQKMYWVDYTNQVPVFSEPSLSIGKE